MSIELIAIGILLVILLIAWLVVGRFKDPDKDDWYT